MDARDKRGHDAASREAASGSLLEPSDVRRHGLFGERGERALERQNALLLAAETPDRAI